MATPPLVPTAGAQTLGPLQMAEKGATFDSREIIISWIKQKPSYDVWKKSVINSNFFLLKPWTLIVATLKVKLSGRIRCNIHSTWILVFQWRSQICTNQFINNSSTLLLLRGASKSGSCDSEVVEQESSSSEISSTSIFSSPPVQQTPYRHQHP